MRIGEIPVAASDHEKGSEKIHRKVNLSQLKGTRKIWAPWYMVSRHFLISAIVTAIIAIIFGIFVHFHLRFELKDDVYQLIPEGFILPKGCDIRMDMQTGETWAKLPKTTYRKDQQLVFAKESADNPTDASEANLNGAPEYKNITKKRIQARLSAEMQANLETALTSLNEEASWEFLEEEAPAMEFGLAILEAKNFEILREFVARGHEKALQIISICLQNNPLAVEKFVELEIHSNELKKILAAEKLSRSVFKKVLRILESFKIYGNVEKFDIEEAIKKHSKDHEDLEERYSEIINLFVQ